MQNQATPNARKFARSLRTELTDGERLLWGKLRMEQLGVKFRRQHPLGAYIADFACLEPKMIVEIDGSQHVEQQAYDDKRDAFFKRQGFAVMRFAANLPFTDLEAVVQAIYNCVLELMARAPIPAFPQRGKEQETRADRIPSALLLPHLGEGRDGGYPCSNSSNKSKTPAAILIN